MQTLTSYLRTLDDTTAITALTVALLILTILAFAMLRKPWTRRIRRKSLLTPNEAEFFHRLERALPSYCVFPQVSFAAFLSDDGKLSAKARWSIRARFDRKIADFVICDRVGLNIVALIELDDRTHIGRADRQRDAITKAAGYQTFRFQSRQKPSVAEIAQLFRHARSWTSEQTIRPSVWPDLVIIDL